MAQQCPASVDVTDIQFKLQSKHKVFSENSKLRNHVNLLACASNHGLLFVGNPNAPELQAFILPDVIYAKSKGIPVHLLTTKLPNIPNTIACNADGSMLAVNYTLQGYGVLDIYHVPSFAAADIKTLYSVRLPDENVYALHLLWNPVLSNVIGIVLSNGNFALYTLKDGGAMEMRSIVNQQIQCGCWSPKGKQIVFGHPNGKLQQFKPDLTPVKSIICPPDVHPGPFDTIALHWLSTFQFVVSFLQHGEEVMPNMYIVNAPKGGTPVFINYNDVCYSGSEPRKQQISFMHIAQWNLLLVTSANGVEIGLLGTKDTTDQPQWVHYMLLDEARIEMPLTEASDETYPIGLALDTSPIHELMVGETKLQTMPVIHVLSTHGHLQCFNFLNLTANAVNICSPPAPINYAMSKFRILNEENGAQISATQSVVEESKELKLPTIEPPSAAPTLTFNAQQQSNFNPQNLPLFGAPEAQSSFVGGWDQKPQSVMLGVATSKNEMQPNLLNKPVAQAAPMANTKNTLKTAPPTEVFKPLYTVSPEFAPPPIQTQQQPQQSLAQYDAAAKSKLQMMNLNETNRVIQQMIVMQITAFEKEIMQLGRKSKLALNEDHSVMKSYSKRLINLQEIIEQANERDFVMDVQELRHSLTESYEMLNECRSKLEMYKNPDNGGVKYLSFYDCVSQRQLKSLQGYLAINQSIMKRLEEQMDVQWTYYQDLVRRNSKSQMRIPCLDGIYQQLTKLKNLITQQQSKLHYIKSIIKQKDLGSNRLSNRSTLTARDTKIEAGIVSLADSILSMSIHNITDAKSNKLSESKLNALRKLTNQQVKVTKIKPQRPNRVELTSEVILETKQLIKKKETKEKESKAIKASKAAAKVHVTPKQEKTAVTTFQPMKQSQPMQALEAQLQFTKEPSAGGFFGNSQSSAPILAAQPKDTNLVQPTPQTNVPFSSLNFTGGNMFVKNESTKSQNTPELSKFVANTNTFKPGVVESKSNTVVAPNKTMFSKPDFGEKSPSSASNFSFMAADHAKLPFNTFNIGSKGFAGFGQQPLANANANNLLNTSNKTADANTANQASNTSKTFSFGNTFNALTDLKSGAKASATQNQTNLPTVTIAPAASATATAATTTATIFSGTTAPPTIFSKQNENQTIAPTALAFSGASAPGLGKSVSEATQAKSAAAPFTKDIAATEQPAAASSGATQSQRDADDMFLKSVNICKPTAKEAVTPKEGSAFSFSLNNENNPQGAFQPMPDSSTVLTASKESTTTATAPTTATVTPSIFGKSATTTESSFSPFSGGSSSTNAPPLGAVTGNNFVPSSAATITAPATTSAIGGAGSSAFSFSTSTVFKQLPTFQNQSPSGTPTTTSTNVSATPATTNAPTAAANTSVVTAFSGTPTAAPATATTIATPIAVSAAPTSPFFSAIPVTKSPGDSLFGTLPQTTPTASPVSTTITPKPDLGTPPTTGNVSAFGGLSLGGQAAASGGSIFGNASSAGFGVTPGGIFGSAATAAMPTSTSGGAASNTSTGSIFGNNALKSGDTTATSIFGNSPAKPAESTAGSIFASAAANSAEGSSGSMFGGSAAKSPENVNVFGSPTSAAAAVSSGSIFGQSGLGQSSGSIFAGAAIKPDSTASSAAGFSFVGSAFGSAAKSTAASAGPIFGNGAAAPDSQQANIFTSQASGFGAAPTSPFSSFSQTNSSVASTGFGSPTQQPQTGAFSRPVFGGTSAFGSPPAFGAQPSFGGAPTFGSPKGFGTFSTPTTSSFGAPTTQSSNIFEALGSTDNGLTFGNLAQTTNAPPNAPKPIFGGSSFMNYRQ